MREIDALNAAEKRALLESMLRQAAKTPGRLEDHRNFRAFRSRMHVVSHWTEVHPFFKAQQGVTADTTRIGGRVLRNFSTYNYLGLSGDPRVSQAAKDAIDRYGTSPSASRIASGEKELHRELEAELASFLGTQAALVFVSGYVTNVTTIGHLFGRNDLILCDALAHNSAVQGATLCGARVRLFRHNDVEHVEEILGQERSKVERCLIVSEGVFSMDGDVPDLPGLIEIKKKYDATLMIDEAHSLGVLGARGGGVREHFGVDAADVDIWMGTLSKSLASCGGYIAGSSELVEYLKYTAPGFVYSVGSTPANTAAALAALRILQAEPERVARLQSNSRLFLSEARAAGLDTHLAVGAAVIPVVTGSSYRAIKLAEGLYRRAINVDPVVSPAVEQDKSRLRFFVTAAHTEAQIRDTVRATVEEINALPSRVTVGGETLARLPSLDRADLPSGRITDPGRSYFGRSRLVDPVTGAPEKRFDPAKEEAHGSAVRAFYERFQKEGSIDTALCHDAMIVVVPGTAGQAGAGLWRGNDAFEQFLAHQARARRTSDWSVEYVMPYADEVIIGGRRTIPSGSEWYLHLVSMAGGKIARIEEVLDGRAWEGEGARGPRADAVLIEHDPNVAALNLELTRGMYDAFVRKNDIENVIARCAPDVLWEVHGPEQLPFAGTWRGPDAVLKFWQDLASIMEIHSLWVDAMFARNDQVFSLGGFRSTAISTALAYSDPFLQVATYRNGALVRFVDYFDPRIDLAAYRPDLRE